MNEDGFTLLELIIAITITGIIMTGVFMFFNQGLATWQRADQDSNLEQNIRILKAVLQKDFHNIFYASLYDKNLFRGDYQGLRFLIIEDEVIKRVLYRVDFYDNAFVRETVIPDEEINDKSAEGQTVAMRFFVDQEISRIDYKYYDPVNKNWEESWTIEDRVPAMVKLELNIEGEKRLLPLIIDVYQGKEY